MWRVRLSRSVNRYLLRGRPDQMVSSRAYEQQWTITIAIIDRCFFWHIRHCERAYRWERQHNQQETVMDEYPLFLSPRLLDEVGEGMPVILSCAWCGLGISFDSALPTVDHKDIVCSEECRQHYETSLRTAQD